MVQPARFTVAELREMYPGDLVELVWPPSPEAGYDPEAVAGAARAARELVTYLCRATVWPDQALPYPAATYDVVGAVSGLLDALPQLLDQLARAEQGHGADARLAHDGMGGTPDFAAVTAAEAAEHLQAAAEVVRQAAEHGRKAHNAASHLYYRDVR